MKKKNPMKMNNILLRVSGGSYIFLMGSSSSTHGRKNVFEAKINNALKTGVLNVSDMVVSCLYIWKTVTHFLIPQDVKGKSSFWSEISNESLIRKLKSLDISGNNLKSIPREIQAFVELKTLVLSRCSIQRQDIHKVVLSKILSSFSIDLEPFP
jgi:Leucine-rich repeat (LRR) protein